MKDAGTIIDFNKVKSKVYNDPASSGGGQGASITSPTKKYLVIDHAGRPVNADANFVSKMSRRE